MTNELEIRSQRDEFGSLDWPHIIIHPIAKMTSRHQKHIAQMIVGIRAQEDFEGATNRRNDNWEAVNTSAYSISLKHEAILYQYRKSWGSKYGTQVRKSYYLAVWAKAKDSEKHFTEREIPAATARAAVRLFPDDPAGPVEYLLGKREKPAPVPLEDLRGFKLVRERSGEFFSFYDGETPYEIGKSTQQNPHPNHGGGLYMYLSQEMCDPRNIATITEPEEGERLAILEVVGAGKRIRYPEAGKFAVRSLTPVRVVRYLDLVRVE